MPVVAPKQAKKAETPKTRVREPAWLTPLKAQPVAELAHYLLPDVSVVKDDKKNNSAQEFYVKVKVKAGSVTLFHAWKQVTVRLTDLSLPIAQTAENYPNPIDVRVWVNLAGGEYPVTLTLPDPIPDPVYDPDFDNEVQIEVDPEHQFPEINRANNILRLTGTTIG